MKILRFGEINRDIFEAIKAGTKEVETRAASPKFSGIKIGDTVILKCGRDKIEKKVVSVKKFKGIKELLSEYELSKLDPGIDTVEKLEKMYYSFPGYREKIKKYGLVALIFQ
jgi:ASC-1-like (ASCH) protein